MKLEVKLRGRPKRPTRLRKIGAEWKVDNIINLHYIRIWIWNFYGVAGARSRSRCYLGNKNHEGIPLAKFHLYQEIGSVPEMGTWKQGWLSGERDIVCLNGIRVPSSLDKSHRQEDLCLLFLYSSSFPIPSSALDKVSESKGRKNEYASRSTYGLFQAVFWSWLGPLLQSLGW